MGRTSIYSGAIFSVLGFIAGVYALSFGPSPDLPASVLLVLCPAALLGALTATSQPDSASMWLIALLNALLYGGVGLLVGRFFQVEKKSQR